MAADGRNNEPATATTLWNLSDDVLLNIFFKLDDDPRHWSRLACVCVRFNAIIESVCCKTKCSSTIPSVVSDLLHSSSSDLVTLFASPFPCSDAGRPANPKVDAEPPGGWFSLHKVNVCCPGLLHAGVLFDTYDYGLERAIGPDHDYAVTQRNSSMSTSSAVGEGSSVCPISSLDSCTTWSLFDDLFFDTVYDESECNMLEDEFALNDCKRGVVELRKGSAVQEKMVAVDNLETIGYNVKRRKKFRSTDAHLASGIWNLSREQGNKLLASRFRGDCLYICDWPGCEHVEEERNYKLFRGVFKNFKRSRVWRSIRDSKAKKIGLNCAFCSCEGTWDLLSCFCLRRLWEYHEDGEPVVRAYVCENGHVSGAWIEKAMCT
ncbi:phytochrome A-associated F-box protein-like [Nymphaea colorata]|nr:phytochrome A-associated F-box protein-like [Nymphaea colorata]